MNFDVLLKLEQYNKDITKLNKERENMLLEIEREQEARKNLQQEINRLKSAGESDSKALKKIKEENEEMKQKHEIFMNEKIFFLQVIYIPQF